MSSRTLKKLNPEYNDIPKLQESSDESPVSVVTKNFNRFDILNNRSQSESDEKDEATEEIVDDRKKVKKSNAKRKKKKKNRQNKSLNVAKSDNSEDEIERTVREVNELLGEVEKPAMESNQPKELSETEKLRELLNIQARHLDPNYEMTRLTGLKRQIKRRKPRDRAQLRHQNMLITKEEEWYPIVNYGLSMELLYTKDNIHFFAYVCDAKYKEAQKKLLEAVNSNNANSLVPLINEYPYHLDTLLQLSDVCRITEDHDVCVQLIKQGVYALEYVFHPMFNLTKGNCRLEYAIKENRAFHILLMKYTTLLGQRTFHRTALEFCKILLSLDPVEDPLATILLVDYHALRAKEYKWLIDLIDFWNITKNLFELPNIMYSYALAHFFMGQIDKSNWLLQQALCMFPSVFLLLTEACSVEFDRELSSNQYFQHFSLSSDRETDSLRSLVKMYVKRNWIIWKDAKVITWLGENAKSVLGIASNNYCLIEESERLRNIRYKRSLPNNISRHIVVCHFDTSLLRDVPRNLLSFDPFPPFLETLVEQNEVVDENPTVDGRFFTFLASLLPSYEPPRSPGYVGNTRSNNIRNDPLSREIHFASVARSIVEDVRNFLLSSRQELRAETDEHVRESLSIVENESVRADEVTGEAELTGQPRFRECSETDNDDDDDTDDEQEAD